MCRLALAGCLLASALSHASNFQDATPLASVDPAPAATNDPQPGRICSAPAGAFVEIEILDAISSATAVRGQDFRIRLAEPLMFDDRPLLPAGLNGVAQIVHADRSRGGGKPGELLLAARSLDNAGQPIALRGLKMGGSGEDRTTTALATSFAIGPFAHFIRGREIEIPAGTRAHARLSAELEVSCDAARALDEPEIVSEAPQLQGGSEPTAVQEPLQTIP